MGRRRRTPWRENLEAAAGAILLAVMFKYFVLEFYRIPSGSMQPTLYGAGAPRTFQTDGQGRFRYLSLYPGKYEIRAELEGLQTVIRENIDVRIGQNTQIDLQMGVAAVADTVTVTAESPLLDSRKTGAGITVTQVELESIPTSRDPWTILSQAPGVQTDRINVGG